MKLRQLFTDDDAVSPVIGVILMVAITVILAAVIGAFVLGFGDSTSSAPSASISAEYNDSSEVVTFTHDGGDPISEEYISASADVSISEDKDGISDSEMTAGDTVTASFDSSPSDGDTITLNWNDGDTSSTLATYEHET